MSLKKPPEPQPRSGPLGPVIGGEPQKVERPAERVRGDVWRVWDGKSWKFETRAYSPERPLKG